MGSSFIYHEKKFLEFGIFLEFISLFYRLR